VTSVYVAAGSNVEPQANLRRALDALSAAFPRMRVSRAYRNRAVGFDGDDFVNLVVELETDLPLDAVLERLHAIEAACGRSRNAPKWAPRALDLDVLLYGDLVGERPGATLPRPDLLRRAYMLRPAAELAPALVHPTEGRTLAQLWAEFPQHDHAMSAIDLGWPP
jgi:2-amino-4-hydroxy-6-hydroxymethyldihydropteridine diphosphokinase